MGEETESIPSPVEVTRKRRKKRLSATEEKKGYA
jgi:hypothetical protein